MDVMKLLVGIVVSLAVICGLAGVIVLQPINSAPTSTKSPEKSHSPSKADVSTLSNGRYVDYSAAAVGDASFDQTILFFYAPWCPECRAFEQSIKSSTIPKGVQILKVDYDSASSLKSQYKVTIQTTFVRVNKSGERISLWVGYSKDKTIYAILENT